MEIKINWAPNLDLKREELNSELNRVRNLLDCVGTQLNLKQLNNILQQLEQISEEFNEWVKYDKNIAKDGRYHTRKAIKETIKLVEVFKEIVKNKNRLIKQIDENLNRLKEYNGPVEILEDTLKIIQENRRDFLNTCAPYGIKESHISDVIEKEDKLINEITKRIKSDLIN